MGHVFEKVGIGPDVGRIVTAGDQPVTRCRQKYGTLQQPLHMLAVDTERTGMKVRQLDVAPFEALALLDVALELDVMGDAQRKIALIERGVGWRLLAPNAEPALAVEHLARFELAFRRRDHVRVEADRRPRRLLAQSRG